MGQKAPSGKIPADAQYEDYSGDSEIVYEEEIFIDSYEEVEEPLSLEEGIN